MKRLSILIVLLPFICAHLSEHETDVTFEPTAQCEFAVHRDGRDGPLVKGVALDVELYYSIRCQPQPGYCLHVSNCTVSDEESSPYPIIDQDGCSLDTSLFKHVEYHSDFMAGIFNPLPIRFRGSSTAVSLYCNTSLRPTDNYGFCNRARCGKK